MIYHIKVWSLTLVFLGGIALTGCESAYFPLPNIAGIGIVALVGLIACQ